MAEPRTVRENANSLTSEEIAAILPHRYPFALVDRILDYEPGQWAIGRKCVTRNEEFFCGHFPGQPVMPGVLILEALAQTGAVAALSLPENKGKLALFGGIKNARFRKQVTPGDVLTLHCELVEQRGPVGIGKATACTAKCKCRAKNNRKSYFFCSFKSVFKIFCNLTRKNRFAEAFTKLFEKLSVLRSFNSVKISTEYFNITFFKYAFFSKLNCKVEAGLTAE